MQKRILVPLDGSELAEKVLGQLRRLLVAADREAVLFTVVVSDPDPKVVERRRQVARDHLAGLRDALLGEGALVSIEVQVGDAAPRIAEYAARSGCEMVVMATHGRSGVMRLLRGSVAEAVIRNCPVPVLVVNPLAADAAEPGGALWFRKILVPLDGSDVSMDVLPLVVEIARRYGSEVLLLQVDPAIIPLAAGDIPLPLQAMLRTAEQVTAALEPARRRLAAEGIQARALAGFGPEAQEIVDAAAREQVDLVVMSTHGRTGLSRLVFGSVAEYVLRHCARPLLVRRVYQVKEAPEVVTTPPM